VAGSTSSTASGVGAGGSAASSGGAGGAGGASENAASSATSGSSASSSSSASSGSGGSGGGAPAASRVGAYFTQWGVYGRDYEVADVVTSGAAIRLTFINYAFGNLYEKNGGYECGIVNKMETGSGDGGDAWADFGRTPKRRVDPADTIQWDDPLAGNFRELKALKAKFPGLKIFISLGGWTWSKHFSSAAKTDALRKQLVSSCVDLYVKGNLPVIDGRGGPGAAAGIFDGIDID